MNFFLFLFVFSSITFALPSKEVQFRASLGHVLKNATRPDVKPGMVVASPSRKDPDYYFDWVRDTALTYKALIEFYEISNDQKIKQLIFDWIEAETYRQNMPTLSGLGEPKFNVDGSGFSGPWGRPQNDGPALRALSMIRFARILIAKGEVDYVQKNIYTSILPANSPLKKDLEYTAHQWRDPSFDLWEEEMGMHFYTLLTQYTALSEGAIFVAELGDSGAAEFYKLQAGLIAKFLNEQFRDESIGLKTTIRKVNNGLDYKTSNIDVAPLLAIIHTYPYQKIFSPHSNHVKKYIEVLVSTFKNIYSINHQFPELGVAIGRYPEDRYDGYKTSGMGNPWFLSTLALAEYQCHSAKKNQYLSIQQSVEKQFSRVLFHSDRLGSLSEQFHFQHGKMQGAENLTWSHNAFMTAMMRCGFVSQLKP